ncbi:MAG: ribonuclease P protein component [Planctomycetota bacterium]
MPSAPATSEPAPIRLWFRARHRLSRDRDYQAVFGAKVRKHRGPLTVFACPNDLGHARLGLSVGRRVGGAVTRNAIKRRLREAFRHLGGRRDLGLDVVVTVRRHEVLTTEGYQTLLAGAIDALAREWRKRGVLGRGDEPDGSAKAANSPMDTGKCPPTSLR